MKAQDLARKFRSLIVPEAGRALLEIDYRSFHAAMLAFEARDHVYMRLARMEGGVHSYLAAIMVGEPADINWPDRKLEDYLERIKKEHTHIRNEKAKRSILGWQQGMEGFLLSQENPEIFPKRSDGERMIQQINETFPDCARYRREVIRRAHNQGFLKSRYGYIRWFHEALKRCPKCKPGWIKDNGKWINRISCPACKNERLVNGDEAKEAAAFENSNNAHGHLKDKTLELEQLGLLERAKHVNYVHDSLVFEPSKREAEQLAQQIAQVMVQPNPVLVDEEMAPEGMWVGVEAKISYKSLAEQEVLPLDLK